MRKQSVEELHASVLLGGIMESSMTHQVRSGSPRAGLEEGDSNSEVFGIHGGVQGSCIQKSVTIRISSCVQQSVDSR